MAACGVTVRGVLAVVAACMYCVSAELTSECVGVAARTHAGRVCGVRRDSCLGSYASFLGVPYAEQPLAELRFQELQPLEGWQGYLQAVTEGPVCPQHDVFYGRLMTPQGFSEACIHANIHVPLAAVPREDLQPSTPGLPILVFVHGGGFGMGSGDEDIHGPERLVTQGVIVITFNYRLNVFGFLSLNSPRVPGNNGLRDIITLLHWVRQNAANFGGNPRDVTLAGQSAGASAAHLVALSTAAKGLFKRVILMSGTAIPSFYSTLPAYAQFLADGLLNLLAINTTNPEEIHRQLVLTPLDKLMAANSALQDQIGIVTFLPVVENPIPGVTRILDDDPEILLAKGRGKNIPLIVGYTTAECESFRPRFEQVNVLELIKANPLTLLSPQLTFSMNLNEALELVTKVQQRYFNRSDPMDDFIQSCSDTYFKYPALRLAEYRQATGGAPLFLYEFGYDPVHSVLREAMRLNYTGAAHVEDLTFVFRVNSVKVPWNACDSDTSSLMTRYVTNFMHDSDPTNDDGSWSPVDPSGVRFQSIESGGCSSTMDLTAEQMDVLQFFNSIRDRQNVNIR